MKDNETLAEFKTYCAIHHLTPGVNDLETLYPDIATEWDYAKNERFPSECAAQSNKKVHWICPEGHEYQQTPNHRVNMSCGCPICAGRVTPGINDFTVMNPELAAMWDYDKNGDLDPTTIPLSHKEKCYFKCPEGHEFYRAPSDRMHAKHPCPICVKQSSSFTEQLILTFAHHVLPEGTTILERNKDVIGCELDIYIPSLSFAIEPGAWAWHAKSNKLELDFQKRELCKAAGIRLFTIYDAIGDDIDNLPDEIISDHDIITIRQKMGHRSFFPLQKILEEIFSQYVDLSASPQYDWDELGRTAQQPLKALFPDENRLDIANPAAAALLSSANNVDPSKISIHHRVKYLWTCPHCHREFKRGVRSVAGDSLTYCPHCHQDVFASCDDDNPDSGAVRHFTKENALTNACPDIAQLYSNKNNLSARYVSIHDKNIEWWVCPHCDGEFEAEVRRVANGKRIKCPICSQRLKS